MKKRWTVVAALALVVPFGAALADTAGPLAAPVPSPAPVIERSAEHASFLESAKLSVELATRAAHELAIALSNARRERDIMLVTCLGEALAAAKAAQAAAIATLAAMNATPSVNEARALGTKVAAANKSVSEALQNAALCQGEEDGERGTQIVVEVRDESSLDPGSSTPGVLAPVEPPAPTLPPGQPPTPTIDVMEPGTDIPPTPPTASPMR